MWARGGRAGSAKQGSGRADRIVSLPPNFLGDLGKLVTAVDSARGLEKWCLLSDQPG